jgi:hypothetical protein
LLTFLNKSINIAIAINCQIFRHQSKIERQKWFSTVLVMLKWQEIHVKFSAGLNAEEATEKTNIYHCGCRNMCLPGWGNGFSPSDGKISGAMAQTI